MGLEHRDTSDLISIVSFTSTVRHHIIRVASAPFTSSSLAKFGWVSFAVCNVFQRSRTEKLRTVGKNSGSILSLLCTKFHKILGQCRGSLVISSDLTDCLWLVSFRRQSSLSLEVVEEPNNCKSFWLLIFLKIGNGTFFVAAL